MRVLVCCLCAIAAWASQPAAPPAIRDYPITAVPLTAVTVTGGFWAPKFATNQTVSIPHIIAQNEATGRVANFLKAAHTEPGAYQGQRYNDTDVYKDSLLMTDGPVRGGRFLVPAGVVLIIGGETFCLLGPLRYEHVVHLSCHALLYTGIVLTGIGAVRYWTSR